MQWFDINEATDIVGKSSRTVRNYLSKYKKQNPTKKDSNKYFKYEIDSNNTKKLQLSELFLHTFFNVEIEPLQGGYETYEAPIEKDNVLLVDKLEADYKAREEQLKQYFDNQLEDIKEAKQQTIDLLKEQLDKTDYNLNKVLEQYSMAQLTIQNLTTPQENKPLEISNTDEIELSLDEAPLQNIVPGADEIEVQEILQEQQKFKGGLRTTKEYYKEHYPTIKPNSGLNALLNDKK